MTALPTKSKTPQGVSINARNVNFKLERALATDWADNDAVLTAIFNASIIIKTYYLIQSPQRAIMHIRCGQS